MFKDLVISSFILATVVVLFVGSPTTEAQQDVLTESVAECDSDSDCEEKFPCGLWYGNDRYSFEMSEEDLWATFYSCANTLTESEATKAYDRFTDDVIAFKEDYK
jgi:hypothetical protein